MRFLTPLITLLPSLLLASYVSANTPLGVSFAEPVPVTLFVMSRCPDAMRCEKTFSKVFNTENLPKVKVSLSYIGSLKKNSDGTTTITCMHGAQECAGNVQELCFKKYNPDHSVWFRFVNELNTINPQRIGDIQYAHDVAKHIGAADNFDSVAQCAQSDEGHQLHVASIQHTLSHQVSTSCTVFIDHQKRCVADGGVWRDCPEGSSVNDFVKSIRRAAQRDFVKVHLPLL